MKERAVSGRVILTDSAEIQPLSLPRPEPGRAVLQQDQTMSSGGDAL